MAKLADLEIEVRVRDRRYFGAWGILQIAGMISFSILMAYNAMHPQVPMWVRACATVLALCWTLEARNALTNYFWRRPK